jgi:Ca-activated chloride channel family protein
MIPRSFALLVGLTVLAGGLFAQDPDADPPRKELKKADEAKKEDPAQEEAAIIERILRNLGTVDDRLSKRESLPETRRLQAVIRKDLEDLLKKDDQQQGGDGNQQQQQQQPNGGQQQQPNGGQQQQQSGKQQGGQQQQQGGKEESGQTTAQREQAARQQAEQQRAAGQTDAGRERSAAQPQDAEAQAQAQAQAKAQGRTAAEQQTGEPRLPGNGDRTAEERPPDPIKSLTGPALPKTERERTDTYQTRKDYHPSNQTTVDRYRSPGDEGD